MMAPICRPVFSGIAGDMAGPVGLPTVATLFASGAKGCWYDPSDIATLFQDSAGTTPVTASGQPVGRMLDKSGLGNHLIQATAAARPTYTVAGALRYLVFDGVDDFMVAASATMAVGQKLTSWIALTRDINATTAVAEMSANSSSNNGAFLLRYLGTGVVGWALHGDTGVALSQTAARTAPETLVTSCLMDIAGVDAATELPDSRVNNVGGLFTPAGAAGDGDFGIYDFYLGARGGASLFFDGNIYGLVVVGKTATEAEITGTNRYLATKSGITI